MDIPDWMPRIQHEDMAAKEVLASWISRIRFKKGRPEVDTGLTASVKVF